MRDRPPDPGLRTGKPRAPLPNLRQLLAQLVLCRLAGGKGTLMEAKVDQVDEVNRHNRLSQNEAVLAALSTEVTRVEE